MRWERVMVWVTGLTGVICGFSAALNLSAGVNWLTALDSTFASGVAWLGWLSALRWREAAETKDASLDQIKQNWSAE